LSQRDYLPVATHRKAPEARASEGIVQHQHLLFHNYAATWGLQLAEGLRRGHFGHRSRATLTFSSGGRTLSSFTRGFRLHLGIP